MGKIVAIGGGDMRELETLAIDKEIIALSGKSRPRALFIPTASSDSREYWQAFQNAYGAELGCDTNVLYLLNVNPTKEELEEKILTADVIYVGGGNTLLMMRRWRRLGVDKILEAAYGKGIVLSGLSAGCICWFNWGHSDSMASYHPDNWSYIRVKGMGFIDALGCPHYDSATAGVEREQDFQQMVRKHSEVGVAIDNNCAIEIIDDTYRIITSQDSAGAYKLYKQRSELAIERIEQNEDYAPIAGLLQK